MHAEYYNKVLYPLQDRAIVAFKDSPFYLTGGTTLSRGYYNHRFSDDLDYFVNCLSLRDGLSLKKALLDVDSKAAGIAPLLVAKRLAEYDYSLLDTEVKWVNPVASPAIKQYLSDIALCIVKGTL